MVLLVVDTQKLLVNDKLFAFEHFVENIKKLIDTARKNRIEVIYIVHDDGIDSDLTKGKDGYEVYEEFKPRSDEKIYEKRVNSPFRDTSLLNYLDSIGEHDIIVAGLQTDLCIDAAVKCGFEHRLKVIVPAYANSTKDNEFMSAQASYEYYNQFIWKNRYAECLSMEMVLERMERQSNMF